MMSLVETLPVLRLRSQEDRRLAQGHLWVFSNEVDTAVTALQDLSPGQQVRLENHAGKPLGVAMVNPNSLICARLVSRHPGTLLDSSLLKHRLQMALSLRQQCYQAPYYRLTYGDADGLPGLVIDRYNDVYVVQIATAGMELLKDAVVAVLINLLSPRGILMKNDAISREQEGLSSYIEVAYGEVPERVQVMEGTLSFSIDVREGQKTGWFYDHAPSRLWLATRSKGLRVLDVFSYVGAWGLQAAQGGARQVLAVDSSVGALELLQANALANGVAEQVQTRQGDAFEVLTALRQEGALFDVVIIDPPAFIKRRKDHKNGLMAYRRINELAMRLLDRNGLLVSCSCSMHLAREELVDTLRAASRHIDRMAQIIYHGHQGADHPIHPAIPETEYLKTVIARINRAE